LDLILYEFLVHYSGQFGLTLTQNWQFDGPLPNCFLILNGVYQFYYQYFIRNHLSSFFPLADSLLPSMVKQYCWGNYKIVFFRLLITEAPSN
jgi:hypothetical protein